jgi:hypothetical protein
MSDQRADSYRREAVEIREAAELVRDPRFREQLLRIAQDYDAAAGHVPAERHAVQDARSNSPPAREPIVVPISTRLDPSSRPGSNLRNS